MDDYAWSDEVMGMTLTFLRGPALPEVGEVLGFRWDTERPTRFSEAEERQGLGARAYAVQVGHLDGWTVLVEPNGYAAGTSDTVLRLSRGGTAVSLFWTVNGAMGFVLADDGVLVRAFDPLLYDLHPQGEPLPQEQGLPFGEPGEHLPRAALLLAERLTGVRIERAWIMEAPRRTWTTTGSLPPGGSTGMGPGAPGSAAGGPPVVPGILVPLPENLGGGADA